MKRSVCVDGHSTVLPVPDETDLMAIGPRPDLNFACVAKGV